MNYKDISNEVYMEKSEEFKQPIERQALNTHAIKSKADEIKDSDKQETTDLTLGNWLMTFLTMDIPIIGYLILLRGAFGKNVPQIKRSMCKAYLIKKLIFTTLSVIVLIILFYIGSYWLDKVLAYMQQL